MPCSPWNLEERVKERTHQLDIANECLQASDRIKSDFLSTVSHELRMLLTSILSFSKRQAQRCQEVLLQHVDRTAARVQREARRVQENLGIVVEAGERLTHLINDVLNLAKIEASKVKWQMTAVSLRDVCQSAINSTAALARDKHLRGQLVTHGEHF